MKGTLRNVLAWQICRRFSQQVAHQGGPLFNIDKTDTAPTFFATPARRMPDIPAEKVAEEVDAWQAWTKWAIYAASHVRLGRKTPRLVAELPGTIAGCAGAPWKDSTAPWRQVGNDSTCHGVNSFGPSCEVLDGAVVFGAIQQGFLWPIGASTERTVLQSAAVRVLKRSRKNVC